VISSEFLREHQFKTTSIDVVRLSEFSRAGNRGFLKPVSSVFSETIGSKF